jgi:hypothetical protein
VSDTSLFICLYLDEDVSVFVAHLLRPHGFEVLTTKDAHNLGSTDAAQLHSAATHRLTLLTHNRVDFELLHTEALRDQQPHAGILVANRRASDFDLARRIMPLLNRFTAEEQDRHLLTVLHYVLRNPMRAGLVEHAMDWPWLSLRFPHLSDPPPVEPPTDWLSWVDPPLVEHELTALRTCVNRQQPFGTANWQATIAATLGLNSTLRPRGRPRKSPEK